MTNIAIVEDVKTIREGLKTLLESSQELNCTGVYKSFENFSKCLSECSPDVILLDIDLPGIFGVEGIKKLKTLSEDFIIIVLTVYEENDKVFDALRVGANSYLVKNTPAAKMIKLIEDAVNGSVIMNSFIARKVLALFKKNRLQHTIDKTDKQILNILIEGNNLPALGAELNLTVSEIKKRFNSIYKILHSL
ncbi:MAG: response regulator transcription factor [Ignavibacteria bacterium]|jgi:DNA-binding NarL/FixJ family response regulator